ncbi:hypothetical protein D3C75_1152210 [compost metagenome]
MLDVAWYDVHVASSGFDVMVSECMFDHGTRITATGRATRIIKDHQGVGIERIHDYGQAGA